MKIVGVVCLQRFACACCLLCACRWLSLGVLKGEDYYVALFAHRSSFARVGWLVFFPFSFLPFRFFFAVADAVVLLLSFGLVISILVRFL